MDFSKLDTATPANAGEALQIINPFTGEPLEGTIILLRGADSAEFQRATKAAGNRRLESMTKKGAQNTVTIEALAKDTVEAFVAVTIGWSGIELDGKELDYSEANARKLYSDERFPWLVEQLDTFVGNRRNFMKASLKT